MNELSNPKNNKLFYCANLKKFINVVLYNVGFIMDQLGKRNYINYVGGNSDYSTKFSWSCNFKDIKDQLPLCESYTKNLSKEIDIFSYLKCLN